MEVIQIETNTNIMVKKSQDMVRNSRYKLSEIALKTLSLLIAQIHTDDDKFKRYGVKIDDFKDLIGSKSKDNTEYMDKIAKELMGSPFKLNGSYYNWTSKATPKHGEGVIYFQIHEDLKPYYLNLKANFLKYNISNVMRLKSPYVIRLYELCKDHFNDKIKHSKDGIVIFKLSVKELREIFLIPKTYQYSSHIKERILEKAKKEFKEKTDIQMNFEEKKLGRKVDILIFKISSNDKGSANILEEQNNFISHIRSNYINADILESKDKDTRKIMMISVDKDGKLYDKKTGENFHANRANQIWTSLFKLAKQDKLPCLTKNTLDLK